MGRTTCMIAIGMLLLGCFTPQVATKKYHVHFGIMHCIETEDYSVDEIYIYKYLDGYYQKPWLKWYTASAGLYHRFNSYGTFDSSYEIKAWDYDTISDDFIGSVKIDSSNIDDEYVRMNYYGDYYLTWTNLTPHYNKLKQRHSSMKSSQPTRCKMIGYKSNIDHAKAVQGHRALHHHIHQGDRRKQTHEAIKKTIHTFKTTSSPAERKSVIDKLKEILGFANPFRDIIKNIHDGKWPTVILYGPTPAVDFGFASFNIEYGIAMQLDGSKAALVLAFNMDVGITEGDEGKIGIGLNRNEIEGVPGWTYGYTKESYEQLTGGITTSFDLALISPNLQEITYTWGMLPSGNSAGYTYTAARGNF